jgi:hypothetical protein
LARALHAGALLDGELIYIGELAPNGAVARPISEAIKALTPATGSIGDTRKTRWERYIPFVHLAAGMRIALATYGVSVGPKWTNDFWYKFHVLDGKWLDLALQIAEERRQIVTKVGLIANAETRLVRVGRGEGFIDLNGRRERTDSTLWERVCSIPVRERK